MKEQVKVLIVEDSPTAADLMKNIFLRNDEFNVIAVAKNGAEAIDLMQTVHPDIISMDINMPVMNGFEATRIIMETNPVPIIIVSASWLPGEVEMTFKAMQAGALTLIEKPHGVGSPLHEKEVKSIHRLFKALSKVKVIRRYSENKYLHTQQVKKREGHYKCVAIGVSTGGPTVLNSILKELDKEFQLPILIVQHIAEGFVTGFIKWLSDNSGYKVKLANDGEYMEKGVAYLAPENSHLGVNGMQIQLSYTPAIGGNKPSVSHLFKSVNENYGGQSIAILLTGMGRDGATELKELKDSGALTIIQNEETALIFGMPGEAKALGAQCFELSPDAIAQKLNQINQNLKD